MAPPRGPAPRCVSSPERVKGGSATAVPPGTSWTRAAGRAARAPRLPPTPALCVAASRGPRALLLLLLLPPSTAIVRVLPPRRDVPAQRPAPTQLTGDGGGPWVSLSPGRCRAAARSRPLRGSIAGWRLAALAHAQHGNNPASPAPRPCTEFARSELSLQHSQQQRGPRHGDAPTPKRHPEHPRRGWPLSTPNSPGAPRAVSGAPTWHRAVVGEAPETPTPGAAHPAAAVPHGACVPQPTPQPPCLAHMCQPSLGVGEARAAACRRPKLPTQPRAMCPGDRDPQGLPRQYREADGVMRSVLCVPGRGDRVPRAHQWARAHLAGRCGISRCGCQDAAGDREGGRDGDSSAAWPGEQPGWEQGGSTPGCCARHPPGGRFSLSKPGMAQLPSAHGTPAPLAALAGAFLGNVKTARDFLVTAVTPSWRGGGTGGRVLPAAAPAPVGAWSELGGLIPPHPPTHLSTMRCQDPHLPPPCPQGCQDRSGTKRRSHCLQPPQWCPHPQSPSHNQEDECHPLATTPSSAWAGGAGPALSIPCVPTSPLLPQAGDTPGAPQSFPTST